MSIQSLTLRFTNPTQQVIGTQEISSTSNGQKSVPITASGILAAFNNEALGTIFTPSIAANYGNDESGNAITRVTTPASNAPNFIPRVISLASVINKTINDVPFNLSSLITTISAGALSYSSSTPSVASVNSSGQVTLLAGGITIITINVNETADHMAGSTSTTLNVTTPTPPPTPPVLEYTPITTTTAGGTIKYTDGPTLTSEPLFVYENPRGTGMEWFAVVTNASKAQITAYAHNQPSGINYFTKSGESYPVPFNNIVTTHMTDMSNTFYFCSNFNENINAWDVAKVTNMSAMFNSAVSFDKPLNNWNVANVSNVNGMFYNASAFNQDLTSWDLFTLTISRPSVLRDEFRAYANSWNAAYHPRFF